MFKFAVLAGVLTAAAATGAAAQSWGVGVGVAGGGPPYYGPPPYGTPSYGPPPYGPPPYYAPPVYAPAPPVAGVSPDAVFDALEDAGYHDFGPMKPDDGIYRLNAVNQRGDLVSLEISMASGDILVERVVAFHGGNRAEAPLLGPAPPPGGWAEAPPMEDDSNTGDKDPEVVY